MLTSMGGSMDINISIYAFSADFFNRDIQISETLLQALAPFPPPPPPPKNLKTQAWELAHKLVLFTL